LIRLLYYYQNTVVAKDKVALKGAKTLIERVGTYLPEESKELVGQAYRYADECHEGQMRKSGEPYIAHPLETALFLANLHLDSHTIIAALLHDVVEDCGVSLDEIDRMPAALLRAAFKGAK